MISAEASCISTRTQVQERSMGNSFKTVWCGVVCVFLWQMQFLRSCTGSSVCIANHFFFFWRGLWTELKWIEKNHIEEMVDISQDGYFPPKCHLFPILMPVFWHFLTTHCLAYILCLFRFFYGCGGYSGAGRKRRKLIYHLTICVSLIAFPYGHRIKEN